MQRLLSIPGMRDFGLSYAVTVAALVLACLWGGWHGLVICTMMTAMEISFSFDNAVVNATVLRGMDKTWQQRFLTWGMLIAVFGMYYLFPLLIVALTADLGLIEVMREALFSPRAYAGHLMVAHARISAFGGMFLLMVFLKFIMDEGKELHWLGAVERKLAQLGKLESAEAVLALLVLLVLQSFLPYGLQLSVMMAGVCGVVLYIALYSVTALCGFDPTDGTTCVRTGLMSFLYLNLLDATFSLDAVLGSFAISNDIVIIVLGLTAGAMFVRSLTVHMVRKGTLERYVFLEHGAHYAIGALAVLMLVSLAHPVSEFITGLAGLALIGLSLWSSVRYNRGQRSG